MNTASTFSKSTDDPAAAGDADSVSSHLLALADQAEALLKATARAGDERVHQARSRLVDELAQIRARLGDLESDTAERLKSAAHRSDEAVHAHPYVGMGAAAAVGLLLGFVLGRR